MISTKLFLTGASGFLGAAILREALRLKISVVATGRTLPDFLDGQFPQLHDEVRYFACDLVDGIEAKGNSLIQNCEVAIHAAGLAHQFGKSGADEAKFHDVNVVAACNVAHACGMAKMRRLVLVSSVGVYGPGEGKRSELSPCNPRGFYSESKLACEREVSKVCESFGLELVILRMATIFGEGDRGNMQRLIETINQVPMPFIGNGKNLKSLIHVEDAASACVTASFASDLGANRISDASHSSHQLTFNVTNDPVSMVSIVHEIRQVLGKSDRIFKIPGFIFRVPLSCLSIVPFLGSFAKRISATISKWQNDDAYDGSKFRKTFCFHPLIDFRAGIRRQVRDFQRRIVSERQPCFYRGMDILLSIISLVALSVPMLAIALIVKFSSRGPILYTSSRYGRANKIFRMPKFRTMKVDAPQLATHLLGDPLVWLTPFGGVLRKLSLDELPQIFSVLKGDMSFVGPRPALFNQTDLILLRDFAGVTKLRPGITGWAQVNGRDELSIPEKVVYDQYYLERRSLGLYVKVVVRTLWQAAIGTGVATHGGKNEDRPWRCICQAEQKSKDRRPLLLICDPETAWIAIEAVSLSGLDAQVISLATLSQFETLLASYQVATPLSRLAILRNSKEANTTQKRFGSMCNFLLIMQEQLELCSKEKLANTLQATTKKINEWQLYRNPG